MKALLPDHCRGKRPDLRHEVLLAMQVMEGVPLYYAQWVWYGPLLSEAVVVWPIDLGRKLPLEIIDPRISLRTYVGNTQKIGEFLGKRRAFKKWMNKAKDYGMRIVERKGNMIVEFKQGLLNV